MQRKIDKQNDKYSDIFNDFIKEINNNNHPSKKIKSDKTNNKNYNKDNKKEILEYENKYADFEDIDNNIEDNKEDDYKEEELQIKLISIENELLKQKIKEKGNILKDYKNKCKQQKSIITNLNKKIQELNEKQKQKEIDNKQKEKEKNNFIKKIDSKDFINESFEEKMAIKFVEQQIAEDIKKEIDKADSNYLLLNKIETIIYNIDNTTFYQCGICMDSFNDGEKINKISCQHIFHIDCLNQWISTNKKCPLCDKLI